MSSSPAPTNVFFITDDYGTANAAAGSQGGGGSHQRLGPNFTSPTVASATQTAFILATAYQRPVRLQQAFGGVLDTLVLPQGANTALTVAPSGTGY